MPNALGSRPLSQGPVAVAANSANLSKLLPVESAGAVRFDRHVRDLGSMSHEKVKVVRGDSGQRCGIVETARAVLVTQARNVARNTVELPRRSSDTNKRGDAKLPCDKFFRMLVGCPSGSAPRYDIDGQAARGVLQFPIVAVFGPSGTVALFVAMRHARRQRIANLVRRRAGCRRCPQSRASSSFFPGLPSPSANQLRHDSERTGPIFPSQTQKRRPEACRDSEKCLSLRCRRRPFPRTYRQRPDINSRSACSKSDVLEGAPGQCGCDVPRHYSGADGNQGRQVRDDHFSPSSPDTIQDSTLHRRRYESLPHVSEPQVSTGNSGMASAGASHRESGSFDLKVDIGFEPVEGFAQNAWREGWALKQARIRFATNCTG